MIDNAGNVEDHLRHPQLPVVSLVALLEKAKRPKSGLEGTGMKLLSLKNRNKKKRRVFKYLYSPPLSSKDQNLF